MVQRHGLQAEEDRRRHNISQNQMAVESTFVLIKTSILKFATPAELTCVQIYDASSNMVLNILEAHKGFLLYL